MSFLSSLSILLSVYTKYHKSDYFATQLSEYDNDWPTVEPVYKKPVYKNNLSYGIRIWWNHLRYSQIFLFYCILHMHKNFALIFLTKGKTSYYIR